MTVRLKCAARLLHACILFAGFAATAHAQDAVAVRVSTDPAGARYTVDGERYYAPATFLWPVGSKHVVSVLTPNLTNALGGSICEDGGSADRIQYDAYCRVRYGFSGWESNLGSLGSAGTVLTQTINADPSLTALTAKFRLEYRVDVALTDSPARGSGQSCVDKANEAAEFRRTGDGVGVVFLGSQCFDYSGSAWLAPDEYTIQAMALEGYAFAGWSINGVTYSGPVIRFKVNGPVVVGPRFVTAKRIQFYTEPRGLQVRVDRTEIATMNPRMWANAPPLGRFDWIPGSKHLIGAPSPQTDQWANGRMWVFQSWSDGAGQDAVYTAGEDVGQIETLVAKFVEGVPVRFFTEPRGLRLNIDGRENWQVYSFVWGLGTKYTVAAPAEQFDSAGRKWVLKGWQHGGPATQEIAVDEAALASGGLNYSAVYTAVPQVIIQSSIPGMRLGVDGAECVSPCRIDRSPGTEVRVSVPAVVPVTEVSRYEFTGWGDTADPVRVITVVSDTAVYQASYRQYHRLTLGVEPSEGAAVRTEPASADGFFPAGTDVVVNVEPKPGFRFRRWEGDLAGTSRTCVLNLSQSRLARALLEKTPYLPPASVRNAAGPTPVEAVAPGSLIAITGASLTEGAVTGPQSPLAQTLGGVVVLIGERILPLVSVSPEEIRAVLPSDIETAMQKLSVRPQSGPEVSSEFNVARNAPGLFWQTSGELPYAVALRENGSAVSADNRARPGEAVTVLGTGFGPYNRPVIDGFPIPSSPEYTVLDPVTVIAAGREILPTWTGAMAGRTATAGVRFAVPADVQGQMDVRLSINGAESNTVVLPIQ